ncbi:MAG: TetR/AcrR family transcriptional regulator [Cyanobacteria bacterium J06638_6]
MVHGSAVLNDKAVQILQGAMREFLQNGYAGTSMDKVAATAGVSKPTVYNYFKDKEGLFRALIQYVAESRCQQVMGDGNLEGPPEVVIRRLITNAIDSELYDLDYQNFVRLVAGESGRFPQLAQAFVEYLTKPAVDQLADYLKGRPDIHSPDPEATARVVLGATVFFILTQSVMHGETIMPMNPKRLVDSLVDLVTRSQTL